MNLTVYNNRYDTSATSNNTINKSYFAVNRYRRRISLHFVYISTAAVVAAAAAAPSYYRRLVASLSSNFPNKSDDIPYRTKLFPTGVAVAYIRSNNPYNSNIMPVSTRRKQSFITNLQNRNDNDSQSNPMLKTPYGSSNIHDRRVVTPVLTRSIYKRNLFGSRNSQSTNDSNEECSSSNTKAESILSVEQRTLSFVDVTAAAVEDDTTSDSTEQQNGTTDTTQFKVSHNKRSKRTSDDLYHLQRVDDILRVESSPVKTIKLDSIMAVTPNENDKATTGNVETTAPTKKSKSSRPKKSNDSITPPINWLDTYNLVKELRQDRTAPCDHSGCEALPDKSADDVTYRFQILFCLMLSSQTKDAVVGATIRKMQQDKVLNIHSIAQMDTLTLNSYINKVGFHNNKTKYIQQVVQILLTKYNGDIPTTADEMIQDLPGVGPKMAYIIENIAWGTQSGIGVDTHMHRIFNQIQWVHKTTTPEQTRIQLQSWIPQQYWSEINLLWVGFGQEVQQEKLKLLQKVLTCSRPKDALQLVQRCGLDYRKVGKEHDMMNDIEAVLQQ